MTVYDLLLMCDNVKFGINDGEYETWELEEMLNESEEESEENEEVEKYYIREDDLEDFEVSYIYGGKYGTVVLQLEESLEDVLAYLRENA